MTKNWLKQYFLAVLPALIPFLCWQAAEPFANLNHCSIGFKASPSCYIFGVDISTVLWMLRYGGSFFSFVGAFISGVAFIYVFLSQIEPQVLALTRQIIRKTRKNPARRRLP